MKKYIVFESSLKTSKIKGELPDVINRYISKDSMIGHHYEFTRDIEDAYVFEEGEFIEHFEVSEVLGMRSKEMK